jgi:hypothetical protein
VCVYVCVCVCVGVCVWVCVYVFVCVCGCVVSVCVCVCVCVWVCGCECMCVCARAQQLIRRNKEINLCYEFYLTCSIVSVVRTMWGSGCPDYVGERLSGLPSDPDYRRSDNRTRDLPACSAVPQPTAPPAACPHDSKLCVSL